MYNIQYVFTQNYVRVIDEVQLVTFAQTFQQRIYLLPLDLLMEVLENIKYSDENLEINIETLQSGGAPNDDLASLEEPTKPVKQLVAFIEENCPPPDSKSDEPNNQSTTVSVDTICQETSDPIMCAASAASRIFARPHTATATWR